MIQGNIRILVPQNIKKDKFTKRFYKDCVTKDILFRKIYVFKSVNINIKDDDNRNTKLCFLSLRTVRNHFKKILGYEDR